MFVKLVKKFVTDADKVIEDKLPIIINGTEKIASGLTKSTTVQDIIFAMVSISNPSFKEENLKDYGIIEKWQGNERILDGNIKIYKLIRLWKSLPGNQLQQVQFFIKKRTNTTLTRNNNVRTSKKESKQETSNNKFAYCTMSPALTKTWNIERVERKSLFVKRQSAFSSDSDCSDVDSDLNTGIKRFASIKRFNRSRRSSVRHIEPQNQNNSDNIKEERLRQLEFELQKLDISNKKSMSTMSDSGRSSSSSIFSTFSCNLNDIDNYKSSCVDIESDTGISSADSQQLETLV